MAAAAIKLGTLCGRKTRYKIVILISRLANEFSIIFNPFRDPAPNGGGGQLGSRVGVASERPETSDIDAHFVCTREATIIQYILVCFSCFDLGSFFARRALIRFYISQHNFWNWNWNSRWNWRSSWSSESLQCELQSELEFEFEFEL